jgi:hypothetical protein
VRVCISHPSYRERLPIFTAVVVESQEAQAFFVIAVHNAHVFESKTSAQQSNDWELVNFTSAGGLTRHTRLRLLPSLQGSDDVLEHSRLGRYAVICNFQDESHRP